MSRTPLIVCVALGIGALCVSERVLTPLVGFGALPVYLRLATAVLALVVWHRWPRRSSTWLVLAGAGLMVPTLIAVVAGWHRKHDWSLVFGSAAQPVLLVGLLGAATAVWRAGGRQAGSALIGTVVAVPILSVFLVSPDVGRVPTAVVVTGLVLAVLTVVAALVAARVPPVESDSSPGWRVTIAGAVAWVAAIGIRHWWPGPRSGLLSENLAEEFWWHSLSVGVVLIAVGVIAGLVVGTRVVVMGLAAGLLLGAVSTLQPMAVVAANQFGMPMVVSLLLALAALAAGALLAWLRARDLIGAAVLGGVAVVLLLLQLVFALTRPGGGVPGLLPLTVAVVFVGSVPILAAFGSALAADGVVPAALAGVVAATTGGVAWVLVAVQHTGHAFDTGVIPVAVPPAVCLILATVLTVMARRLVR